MAEKHTPNWVLILVAIIGMVGTIIAATIQLFGGSSAPPTVHAATEPIVHPAVSRHVQQIPDIPELSGTWVIQTRTATTAHDNYIGLIVRYKVIVTQSDRELIVRGEKWGEVHKGTETEYSGRAKTPIMLEGFIKPNAGGGFDVDLNGTEESASDRKFTTSFRLTCADDGTLTGSFVSTAADCSGPANWVPEVIWREKGWIDP